TGVEPDARITGAGSWWSPGRLVHWRVRRSRPWHSCAVRRTETIGSTGTIPLCPQSHVHRRRTAPPGLRLLPAVAIDSPLRASLVGAFPYGCLLSGVEVRGS